MMDLITIDGTTILILACPDSSNSDAFGSHFFPFSLSFLLSSRGRRLAALKGEGASNNRAHRRHVLTRHVEHGSGGMCWLGSVARASQRRLLHVGRRQRTDEIRRGRWSPGLLQRARGPPACGAVCRAASSAAGRGPRTCESEGGGRSVEGTA